MLTDYECEEIERRQQAPVTPDFSPHPQRRIFWPPPERDPTFIQQAKRAEAVRARYYAGGYRIIRDGVPCRVIHKFPTYTEKADEKRRFPQTTYTFEAVLSGFAAEPKSKHWTSALRQKFYVMFKGKTDLNESYVTHEAATVALIKKNGIITFRT